MPYLAALALVLGIGYLFRSVPLDASLTPTQAGAIRYALANEKSAASLEDFGNQCLANDLPLAAAALHTRAVKLRGGT